MLELIVQPREELGRKVKNLRQIGEIPAVLYGAGEKSINLKISEKDFSRVYEEAGESAIVSLRIGNDKIAVLVYDVASDPVSDKIIHVDFYRVKMDEKITTEVPLKFIGVSPAVKEKGGILVKNIHEVEVEAFPQDLPHQIDVDISPMAEIHDNIYIKDLSISSKVRILAEPDEIVASVILPQKEEEPAPVETTEEVPGPEKPKEGEAAAEKGEPAPSSEEKAGKRESEPSGKK